MSLQHNDDIEGLRATIARLTAERDQARADLEAGRKMATAKFAEHSGLLLEHSDLESLAKEVVRLRAVERLVPELVKALETFVHVGDRTHAGCHRGSGTVAECVECQRHITGRAVLAKARAS